jgi:hypothetical protein
MVTSYWSFWGNPGWLLFLEASLPNETLSYRTLRQRYSYNNGIHPQLS